MQREPRYRAYDKRTKFMTDIQGFRYTGDKHIQLYYLDADGDSVTCTCEKEYIELLEYTWVNDKNGIEIYEGDILKFADDITIKGEKIHASEVQWLTELSGFYIHATCVGYYNVNLSSCFRYKYEVIGNIYQNPELLQEVTYGVNQ